MTSISPATSKAAASGASREQEVTFLSGVNADGTVATGAASWWASDGSGDTARKWGSAEAGTGATISYAFQQNSGFSAAEKQTFEMAFAMWESVANVHFVKSGAADADVLLKRGQDGSAYEDDIGTVTAGAGSKLGQHVGQALISIDTSVYGFDLSGDFEKVGGYGISTAVHEVGHLLGLGHGGPYGGEGSIDNLQLGPYDDQQWTLMSYLSYTDGGARYAGDRVVENTDWGKAPDGYQRSAAHTLMPLDILAAQRLYGAAEDTQLDGGDTFGFNTTLTGDLARFFDFTVNAHPIVTIYDQGVGNTLDLSGFSADATLRLSPGSFSDVAGLRGNLAIADGTIVETAILGSGDDRVTGSGADDRIFGGRGVDTILGGSGDDLLDGGRGGDSLSGGAGDDLYMIDNLGDVIVERSGGGLDTAMASVDYKLAGQVEILKLTGKSEIDGSGNSSANTVRGNGGANLLEGGGAADKVRGGAGDDTLHGGSGDDKLDGGRGSDVLKGGAGADRFLFTAELGSGIDHIRDFDPAADTIGLDHSAFAGLRRGALAPDAFAIGATASDAGDRILYDGATGALFFDRDGDKDGFDPVEFATISRHLALTSDDFLVT